MKIHVVLLFPQIPQNTGNIARTCAAVGAHLHLVEPLGFSISEKAVRRAGLDYWKSVTISTWKSWEDFFYAQKNFVSSMYFATTKGGRAYSEVTFPDPLFLIFGNETEGIPLPILKAHISCCIRIPIKENERSLNLSNSVAILVYEALRQKNFPSLKQKGSLNSDTTG
jgi:tRNA (cytidine/uridine-2'-O-)-methyltransferase